MSILAAVVGFLPFLGQAIVGIEHLFGGGNGASKKAAVVQIANAGLNGVNQTLGKNIDVTSVANELSVAIDLFVSIMNSFGMLRGNASPVASPVAAVAPTGTLAHN
jgi:hypothetical protein